MTILEEVREIVQKELGSEYSSLTIERVVVGLFFTGVKLSNGAGGICYTPVKEIPQAVCCPSSAGRTFDPTKIRGMPSEEILTALSSTEPIKRAVAIATLNALSSFSLSDASKYPYTLKTKTDALDVVRIGEEDRVVVVGALVPALQLLKRRGGNWWILEQDPGVLKSDEMPHFIPAEDSEEVLNDAQVLIITGVTLLNGTLEGILNAAPSGSEITVVGPTASMLPMPLFDRGVRVVGGVRVKNPDGLLDTLAAGGSGYHFFDSLAERMVMEKG